MNQTRVSIIIPVYNGANYVAQAIDSALAQDWDNLEVVVINDGSNDDGATDRICRGYGDRIVYIQKPNGGVASALNLGLKVMTGDIFCWLSHDDRHHPNKTRAQVEAWIDNGSKLEVLYNNYRLIDKDSVTITDVCLNHDMLIEKPPYALLRGSIHGCSIFVPRQILDDIGLFDESLPTTQDYDLWRRVISKYPFRHLDQVLIDSRWHDEQHSKKIDHLVEANAFWVKTVDGIPKEQRIALEGSETRFLMGMANFLGENKLVDSAEIIKGWAQKKAEETRVTVIIPVFNRVDMAISAVKSVEAQTHQSIELIVVDDGSKENMSELETYLKENVPNSLFIRQENTGPGGARNNGWRHATGEYVAFLDSDDLFVPNKIKIQLAHMEENAAWFSHTSYFRHWRGTAEMTLLESGAGNGFPDIIGACGIASPTVMLRRDLFDKGYAFKEAYRSGEDVSLWLDIAERFGVSGINQGLSIVRASEDSTAYDNVKAYNGVNNIYQHILSTPNLAVHTDQVNALKLIVTTLYNRLPVENKELETFSH